MTVSEYARATGTPVDTIRTWIRNGAPHSPYASIELDCDAMEEWKSTKLKKPGRPKAS